MEHKGTAGQYNARHGLEKRRTDHTTTNFVQRLMELPGWWLSAGLEVRATSSPVSLDLEPVRKTILLEHCEPVGSGTCCVLLSLDSVRNLTQDTGTGHLQALD